MATFFAEHYGLPPITGRILGWLMICDPAEQSAGEIADAIGASRASLTTNMRFLIGSGLVRRLTRPGGRTSYYRIDDGMWDAVVRRRISSMVSFSQITVDGMNLIGANGPRACGRPTSSSTGWPRCSPRPPDRAAGSDRGFKI